jgi:hypothetical protein
MLTLWEDYKHSFYSGIINRDIIANIHKQEIIFNPSDITGFDFIDIDLHIEPPLYAVFYSDTHFFTTTKENTKHVYKAYFRSTLNQRFKKNQALIKAMMNKYFSLDESVDNFSFMIQQFNDNNQAFKNNDIMKLIKNNDTSELLNDEIRYVINQYTVEQLIRQLFSKKYRFLVNDSVKLYFAELLQMNYTKNTIQNNVMTKVALFKTDDEFSAFLKNYITLLDVWNIDYYIQKSKHLNIPYEKSNNKLLLRIDTFEQMQEIGSIHWCIQQSVSYFNRYVTSDSIQYIYFDFDKKSINNDSMIGFTMNEINNQISTAHYKNDYFVTNFKIPKEFKKAIISPKESSYYHNLYSKYYLERGYFLIYLKKIMQHETEYYDKAKKLYLNFIKEGKINFSQFVHHYQMLAFKNNEKQKLALFLKDVIYTFQSNHNMSEIMSIDDFLILVDYVDSSEFIDSFFSLIAKDIVTKKNINPYHQRDIVIQLLNLKKLSIEMHLLLFQLMRESIKDFNQLFMNREMTVQINLAIQKNPMLKTVLNRLYDHSIF